MVETVQCPECGSTIFWKDGLKNLKDGTKIQRFLCRKCYYRFSEKQPSNTLSDKRRISMEPFPDNNWNENMLPQVLNMEKTTMEKHQGRDLQQSITGKIIDYLWYLEKKGRAKLTLKQVSNRLKQLTSNGLNLLEPEKVKAFIAKKDDWSNRTKAITVSVYSGFLKFNKITWDPPEYKPERKPYKLPYEQDLEQLISGAGRRLSPFLLVLKETAARKAEAAQLQWTDIDFQRRLISITSKKGGNPRTLPVSERLIEVLRSLKRKGESVFNATLSSISSNYYQQRLKIAKKTGNPRLREIGLHDFRHWKLTMVAHEFNGNAHYIQYFAGHRDLNTQQIYIHLAEQYCGRSASSEFVVELAKNVEEAKKLIAVGFEFVHEYQGIMMYRKRK